MNGAIKRDLEFFVFHWISLNLRLMYSVHLVHVLAGPLLGVIKLVDLQIMVLSAIYLQGTSAPHTSWVIVGVALRFAEDIGVHREKVYGPEHAFENQMWKRVFWFVVLGFWSGEREYEHEY